MKNIFKKVLFTTLILLITFVLSFGDIVYAYVSLGNPDPDFHVSVYFDGTDYLIYADNYESTSCEYALTKNFGDTPSYLPCIQDIDGNNVVVVSPTNASTLVGGNGNATYLWYTEGGTPILEKHAIKYDTALDVEDAVYVKETGTRIPAELGYDPELVAAQIKESYNMITVDNSKKDSGYTYYYYMQKEQDDTTGKYTKLIDSAIATHGATRTDSVGAIINVLNPAYGIESVLDFNFKYWELILGINPYDEETPIEPSWKLLSSDGIITMPLDTEDGDNYVVWLMAVHETSPIIYDMHIYFCEVEGDIGEDIIVMPKTGLSRALDALLITNAIALGAAYLRRRGIVKQINEK